MSNYPLTSHVSKMTKIQNKNSVSKGLNYDKDILRTKNSLDKAIYEQEINKIETQDAIQEPVKEINNYIKYMNNEAKVYDKTTNKYLISALNCDNILNINKEFKQVEELYHSHKSESLAKNKKPNEAFRLYINFNGHNVPAHKVHEISTEIAKRICGNEYKALISTHTNTNNYHSHILINAYNNDGWHKLHEELKIGLKWQRISNIVALENGCDILMTFNENEEFEESQIKEPTKKYRSKNEKQTSIKNKLGKDILMNDINETLKNVNVNTWQDYVNEMQNKGWHFEKNNKNTIIYYKQNFMTKTKNGAMRGFIRETRLGFQYTKNYIEKFLAQKNNEITIKNKVKKINLNQITPPISKDKLINNRLPILFRLIYMLINLLKVLINNENEFIIKNPDSANSIKENTKLLKKQLQYLKSIESKLIQYNAEHPYNIIENETDLKILKKQNLINYKRQESQLKNFDKIRNIDSILKSINEIENNINLINKYNLYDILYSNISDININENLAKLDPMSAKTKSRLYSAIHNSNYVLIKPFNQLTESKAKELLYFLSNEKMSVGNNFPQDNIRGKQFPTQSVGNNFPQSKKESSWETISHETNKEPVGNNFPQELCKKTEYYAKLNEQKTIKNRTKYNDNLKQNQNKFKEFKAQNNISDAEFDKILEIKKHIYKLKSFGISELSQINSIKATLETQQNNLNEIYQNFIETKETLKFINELESYFKNDLYDKYKPLSNLIEKDTFIKMQDYFLKRFNTTTEQILAISKLIDNTIDLSEIENQVLPTTEQKLCVSLISKLSGKKLTENEINNLSIDNIKNLILKFLNTYTKESLEQMAKEYFEKDKLNDIKEQERLKEEESEFIENTEKEIKQEVEQKEIAQKTNFYNLFKI